MENKQNLSTRVRATLFLLLSSMSMVGCVMLSHYDYPRDWPEILDNGESGCKLLVGDYGSYGESSQKFFCSISYVDGEAIPHLCPPTFSDALMIQGKRPPSLAKHLKIEEIGDALEFRFIGETGVLASWRFEYGSNQVICKKASVVIAVDGWKKVEVGEPISSSTRKEYLILRRAIDNSLIVQSFEGSLGSVFGVIPYAGTSNSVWFRFLPLKRKRGHPLAPISRLGATGRVWP